MAYINKLKGFHALRAILLVGVLICGLHGEGDSEQANQYYQTGLLAYQRKDYASALSYFRKAADMENTGAYFYLGVMYRHGQGVVKNLDKAGDYLKDVMDQDDGLEYLNKTAQKGIPDACIVLALFYGLQLASAKDGQEGLKYFQKILQYAQKAADMGDSLGYTGLGMLYYKGVSVMELLGDKPISPHLQQEVQKLSSFQPNYQKALEYFQKAAKMGDPVAYMMLAQMYDNGDGVGQDEEMAKQYKQKACDAGAKDFCP
ncbi:hypothetical protein ASB1_18090 (plasmid) [Helicobacter heilmannii]|uniref:Beta-lactamase n=1 Tax=Helicobacter heilmannii TaxID=35817 RepID=A0A0K2Y8Y0_HELHE|nr:tetratricopeptide repeat protein [Helicobacter heilmannii]BDQ28133.1 hypothetical protein ASB1_18090 [Helicobacter heilmannii]CRI35318.1 hypothetical protein HHE01_03160 [Helicobacter heilmannii]